MCLSVVKQIIKKPSSKVVTGYKSFGLSEGVRGAKALEFLFMGGFVQTDTWLKASGRAIGKRNKKYPAGFHVYASKVGVEREQESMAIKVKIRKIVAHGHQEKGSRLKCYVAKEMFVSSDDANW
jgi:hypothetical protein